MKTNFKTFLIAICAIVLFPIQAVFAQDESNSVWDQVVNPDGSINYGAMTDNGVVTQPGTFMPTIPGFGQINAEYHVYTTPSGNQILMPTATTLFFMALDHTSALYTNPSAGTTPIGISGASSGNGDTLVGLAALGNLFSGSIQSGGQYDAAFFNSIISGEQNIWQLGPAGIGNLFLSFMNTSFADLNLYTYMILIAPGVCTTSPVGCTPEQLALIPTPPPVTVTPEPVVCPPPQVIQGKISFSGLKTAPNYPLVIGQDPDKRGVDLQFSASVAPTQYITHEAVTDYGCVYSFGSPGGGNCGVNQKRVVTGYHCEQHVETFSECVESAHGSAHLSQISRDWILNELSVRYPDAYLHNPEFSFGSGNSCSWSDTIEGVGIEDPGYWDISVNGTTSGTPVSAPRNFGGKVNTFEVWLKEIAIIK